jgi:hypothetical protein
MDVVALSAHSVVAPASIEYIATASAVASSYWSLYDRLSKLFLYLFFFFFSSFISHIQHHDHCYSAVCFTLHSIGTTLLQSLVWNDRYTTPYQLRKADNYHLKMALLPAQRPRMNHVIHVPEWFIAVRLAQFTFAVVALALSIYGLVTVVYEGCQLTLIFVGHQFLVRFAIVTNTIYSPS